MTSDQIKKLSKLLVPVVLAIAAAYGYADSNCVCGGSDDVAVPASSDASRPE